MRLKNSRWTMVMVGVIALLMVGTMVWASPPASAPSAPLQAYDANNADKVDGHHAGPSSGTKAQRANRVLWANKKGQLHWRAMPKGALNKRYLNDDRKEIISAAVDDALLTVNNTGSGPWARGLFASGAMEGVYGESTSGTGVYGKSTSGTGVVGQSGSSLGVFGYSTSNIGVYGASISGYGVWGEGSIYGVFYVGGLAGTGSKSAIVETKDYAWRHLYAMESPELWFEDFGQAQLVDGQAVVTIEPIFGQAQLVDGQAVVTIEPIFAQTVNLSETYHVFLTPLGDEPVLLFVTEKRLSGFTVRGVTLDGEPAAGSFEYRIIAKRLDYEEKRLEAAEDPNQILQEMGR